MNTVATPIYDALVAERACPTCGATLTDECMTKNGRPTGPHKARRWGDE